MNLSYHKYVSNVQKFNLSPSTFQQQTPYKSTDNKDDFTEKSPQIQRKYLEFNKTILSSKITSGLKKYLMNYISGTLYQQELPKTIQRDDILKTKLIQKVTLENNKKKTE